ncbi:MAG: hypothetical protein R3C60_02125 [Parvularculaceae bacterium]
MMRMFAVLSMGREDDHALIRLNLRRRCAAHGRHRIVQKIVSEGAVSVGVRRIEAMTGELARLYLEEQAAIARGCR